MGIPNQRKVHKRLADYDERLEVVEAILKVYLFIGCLVSLVLMVATMFIDQARARPLEIGWMQLLGIGVFGGLAAVSFVLWWMVRKEAR